MKDKDKYPGKTFKLNKQTIKQLTQVKKREGKSWNLLFLDMLKNYENRKARE